MVAVTRPASRASIGTTGRRASIGTTNQSPGQRSRSTRSTSIPAVEPARDVVVLSRSERQGVLEGEGVLRP